MRIIHVSFYVCMICNLCLYDIHVQKKCKLYTRCKKFALCVYNARFMYTYKEIALRKNKVIAYLLNKYLCAYNIRVYYTYDVYFFFLCVNYTYDMNIHRNIAPHNRRYYMHTHIHLRAYNYICTKKSCYQMKIIGRYRIFVHTNTHTVMEYIYVHRRINNGCAICHHCNLSGEIKPSPFFRRLSKKNSNLTNLPINFAAHNIISIAKRDSTI